MPLLLREGSQLRNRYQVIKILDTSPLRNIYLVSDLHLRGNTWVAKQILPIGSELGHGGEVHRRLEAEARTFSSIDHPAIPRLLDFFFLDGCFVLIREFVPGTDLRTLLAYQGGSLEEADALRLAQPIGELLGFLMRKNLGPAIFRELSLRSLIVTPEGEIRIIDFGFSRLFGKANTLGPLDYAAPEQFSGEATDARTLVYNLGAILYHLISGFNPGDSPFDLEPLDYWAPDSSPATLKLVERALKHEPGARFSSPEEMVKTIKRARRSVERGDSASSARTDTQPLQPATISAGTGMAILVLLCMLGASLFAVYEMFLRGGG